MKKTNNNFCLLIMLLFCNISMNSQTQISDSINSNPISLQKNIIENPKGLERTFKKLKAIKEGDNSNLVVVHLGDSHIQMGHFSGKFKYNLQNEFGDCGDGILFPYSACKSVGPRNLKSQFMGSWEFNNITSSPNKIEIGLKGYGLRTKDTLSRFSFNYSPETTLHKSINVKKVKIFHGKNNFQIKLNNTYSSNLIHIENISSNFELSSINAPLETSDFSFKLIKANDSQSEFNFHGIFFESDETRGVQYHECGVVGAQFLQMIKYSPLLIEQLVVLKPNLIIISYGSNESYIRNFDSVLYKNEIEIFLSKIKKELPETEFLFTTTPDTRSNNQHPTFTKEINNTQREIANKNNAALWDLNTVMGGENSMIQWHKNGLANNDKLHFVKSGYHLQGNLLSLSFFNAINNKFPNLIKTDSLISEINHQLLVFKKAKTIKSETPRSSKKIKHVVEKGDTLLKISKKYNCSISSILEANNKTSNLIQLGEKLIIPKSL